MLHPGYHHYLVARQVEKFDKATPPWSKDLAANTLNFKSIFDPPL